MIASSLYSEGESGAFRRATERNGVSIPHNASRFRHPLQEASKLTFYNSSDLCQRQQGRVRIPLSDNQQLVHCHREIGTKSRLVLVGSDPLDTTRRRLG